MLDDLKSLEYYPDETLGSIIADKVMVAKDGTYVFVKGYMLDQEVVFEINKRVDRDEICPETKRINVSSSELQDLKRSVNDNSKTEEITTSLLKRVYRLFEKCAAAEVADIKFHILPDKTKISVLTSTQDVQVEEWTRKDGEAFLTAAFQAADVPDQRGPLAQAIFSYNYFNNDDSKKHHKFSIPNTITGFRAAQSPSIGGYHWVARLFYSSHSSSKLTLDEIITEEDDRELFEQQMLENQGGIFIAGATGEGKSTTSLKYAEKLFKYFNSEKNFFELGNPIEQTNADFIQISVEESADHEKAYLDYMRHLMRAHPHFGNIQEIRDLDQAKLFFNFLQSGHPGLTTFHGDTACDIPFRLVSIGMDPRVIAAPGRIAMLMRQILIYELCPHCAIAANEENVESPLLRRHLQREKMFAEAKVRNREGCEHCRVDDELKSKIWNGHSKLTVVPEFLVPDVQWLSYVRDQDPLGAYEYWLLQMDAKTINYRLREMIRAGRIDPAAAVMRGAFKKIDLEMYSRKAAPQQRAAE